MSLVSYPFECDCGERFKTADAAHSCNKCREYMSLQDRTYTVTDTRTGKSIPFVTDEEQANYAEWKAEQKALRLELLAEEYEVGLDG